MSNWNIDSVLSIISDLGLKSDFDIPLNEARIIVVDTSTFNVYSEYPDNVKLEKEEITSAIQQDLALNYSTFGSSQTNVRVCFYGTAMEADEHVDFIKEALFQSLGHDLDAKGGSQEKDVKSQDTTKTCATLSSSSLESEDNAPHASKKPRNKILKTLISIKKQQRESFQFMQKLQRKIDDINVKVNAAFCDQAVARSLSGEKDLVEEAADRDLTGEPDLNLPGTSGQIISVGLDAPKFKFISAKAAESYFEKKIVKLRDSLPWIQSIRTLRIESIEIETMRKLRWIIISGPVKYGRFINKILLRLFGAEKLMITLMAKHEKRHCLRPGIDRNKVFSSKEERTLKNLLLHIDTDFFKNSQVWEELVRKKANQFGRDLKKTGCDLSDNDQDLDSSDQNEDEN
ncbi:uncharacterized protein LOC107367183 [Tetranychus urticae]|uniref:uncharacterized protein LOC107367183 n=1 Tax=Tetranychus urticae TaxID=32264 RepID=UPI00077BF728|nr:uncharacterized protein LOC107367183 [Tetranychus urticae]